MGFLCWRCWLVLLFGRRLFARNDRLPMSPVARLSVSYSSRISVRKKIEGNVRFVHYIAKRNAIEPNPIRARDVTHVSVHVNVCSNRSNERNEWSVSNGWTYTQPIAQSLRTRGKCVNAGIFDRAALLGIIGEFPTGFREAQLALKLSILFTAYFPGDYAGSLNFTWICAR